MPAAIPRSTLAVQEVGASAGPPPPEPGLLETLGAGFDAARADTTGYNRELQEDAYGELIGALNDLGYPVDRYVSPSRAGSGMAFERIYADVLAERAKGHFADLPDSRELFDRQWTTRERQRIEAAEQTAARGNPVAAFIGGMGGAMTDPVNIASLAIPVPGANALTRMGGEAAVNALVEALLQPVAAAQRSELGRDPLTLGQAAQNVAFAGAGGFVLRGAIETPALVHKAVSENLDKLPAPLRERWQAKLLSEADPLDDPVLLADLTEAIVGRDRLSEGEAAAVEVARREGQFAQANPFRGDGAGAATHEALAGEMIARALADAPLGGRPATALPQQFRLRPPARPVPIGNEAEAIAAFKDRVRAAESGGDDAARNPRSSAAGRYQFTDGTFARLYVRRFGGSEGAALRHKLDPAVQETLMDDLTAENAAALRAAGVPVDSGNLYLAHFAGSDGARRIHAAEPGTSVSSVLGADVVAANPFLKGKSARWLIEWARGKMGGRPGPTLRDDAAGIAGSDAETARIQQALDEAQARADGLAEATRGPDEDPLPDALMTALRGAVATPGQSLNRSLELADALGFGEAEIRQGLERLAGLGEITRNGRTGTFMRKSPGGLSGPDDMVRFIARNGGLAYDGLSAAGRKGGSLGHDLRNTGALARFVPGAGPLLRPNGRGLDEMGELLHDAGYFGPPDVTPRPTEAELIQTLDQVMTKGEKRMSFFDSAPAERAPAREGFDEDGVPTGGGEDFAAWAQGWHDTTDALAMQPLTEPELREVTRLMRAGTDQLPAMDPDAAFAPVQRAPYVLEWLNRQFADVLDAARLEAEDAFDVDWEAHFRADAAAAGGPGRAPEGQPGVLGGDARAAGPADGAGPLGAQGDGTRLADLPAAERSPFLDPDSEAAKLQADSLLHDLRADLGEPDPNIAAVERQRAQLGAEAPLQPKTAQESTLGLGLFGAADGVRLDADGEARPVKDLLDELDAEAAEIRAIRDCL